MERWNTNQLELIVPDGLDDVGVALRLRDGRGYLLSMNALRQIADFCGLPFRYTCRMLEEAPPLLCTNVNHWFRELTRDRALVFEGSRLKAFAPIHDPHD